MNDTPIIDAHHHLYDLDEHYYPWLQDGVKPSVFGDYWRRNTGFISVLS
jgi:predicted TIM-barrel fold metal-dependent hydrolase